MGCHCDGGMIKRGPAPLHVRRGNAASVGKFLPFSLSLSPATKKTFRERKVGGGGKDLRKEECDGGRNYPQGGAHGWYTYTEAAATPTERKGGGFSKAESGKKGGKRDKKMRSFFYLYLCRVLFNPVGWRMPPPPSQKEEESALRSLK